MKVLSRLAIRWTGLILPFVSLAKGDLPYPTAMAIASRKLEREGDCEVDIVGELRRGLPKAGDGGAEEEDSD